MITVAIVARIAGQPDAYIAIAAFAALLVSGATTVLVAVRVGYIGSGPPERAVAGGEGDLGGAAVSLLPQSG